MPKSNGTNEDDELHSLLWGSATNNSDDETDAKKKKASGINRNKRTLRAEARKDDGSSAAASTSNDANTSTSNDGLWGLSIPPTSSRKTHQESRELDKIEAVILQANQMKRQMEDPRTVQQITVVKARAMLDKIDGKKTEEVSRMVLEMIRNEGNGCRASQVWDSLREAKSLVEGIDCRVHRSSARPRSQHGDFACLCRAHQGFGCEPSPKCEHGDVQAIC